MNKQNEREASLKNTIGFGIGNIGSTLFFQFMAMYLTFFYTNVMGLSAAVAGTVFMVARIIDALSDPLAGIIADRTNTKIGKFRPFLNFGAPLAGIGLVLMFWAPDMSLDMKIIYAYTTYIFGSLARTVVDTPYHSIVSLLSSNPNERGRLVGLKNIFAIVTTFLLAPAMNVIKLLGNGIFAWRTLAIFYAVIVTVTYWICSVMIKDKDVYVPQEKEAAKEKLSIRTQLNAIIKNRTILMLIISFATDSFAYQIINAVNVYFFLYNLQNKTELISVTQYPTMLFFFIVAFTVNPIFKKFGKRITFMGIEALLIIPNVALLFVSPENVTGIMAIIIVYALLQTYAQVIAWSVLPDCADYAEVTMGIKSAATITSTFTFMNKMSQALGAFVSGLVLEHLGFVSGAATQSEAVMGGILYMRTLVPIAAYVISIIAMIWYPLKKKDEIEMAQKLKVLREKKEEA